MQLGTLSGNPVAAIAGLKTMEILRLEGQYERLHSNGRRLTKMAGDALSTRGVAHQIIGDPNLFEIVFTDGPVRDYRDVLRSDTARVARFNAVMMEHGVFKSPGKTYPSLALTEEDFDRAYRSAAADIAEISTDAVHAFTAR